MKFIEYVLIKESDLEELYVSDDPSDNIELLHEMEYKMRKIIDNKYKLNPKLYVNVLKRFGNFAVEAYEDLSPKFQHLFSHWLKVHNIDNIDEWAKAVYELNEDAIEAGEKSIGMGGIYITYDEVMKNISPKLAKELIEYQYGSVISSGEIHAGSFLQGKEVPPPPDEYDPDYVDEDYWDNNEGEALDKIYELDLEEEFEDYIISIMLEEPSIYFDGMSAPKELWIHGIKKLLYPQYYANRGDAIEAVTGDVEEGVERFEAADTVATDAYEIISNMNVNDAEVDNDIENLMEIVGQLTTAVSLGMNVMHTSGNIVTDYGGEAGLHDVDVDFLSDFSSREVTDWNAELRKLIR